MIVFLDTNIVIYFVENTSGFGPRATRHLGQLRAAGHTFAVSDLVRMECLIHPLRQGDQQTLDLFDLFFNAGDVQTVPLTTVVCHRAIPIRANHNIGTVDALQLAAAIVHGCDRFLTADARLQRCQDILADLLP